MTDLVTRQAELVAGIAVSSVSTYLLAKDFNISPLEGGSEHDAALAFGAGAGIGALLAGVIVQIARYGGEILPAFGRSSER